MAEPPRVMLLGMLGAFSRAVCESALDAGVFLCGVIVPGGGPRPPSTAGGERARESVLPTLPVLKPKEQQTLIDLAKSRGLAVFEAGNAEELQAAFRDLRPEVLAVACWPRLIPQRVRELAHLAVNVHPSLLPENRGPAPLFWTFRLGQRRTGVTVHLLEERADAGAILAQREVTVRDGMSPEELELELAQLGGRLLAEVVTDFARGSLNPQPQDESRATYYPAPDPDARRT